jgi:hypothetical protein
VQRAPIAARRDFRVGSLGARERMVARDGNDRTNLRIEARDSREVDRRQALGRQRLCFDPARQLRHSRECDRIV